MGRGMAANLVSKGHSLVVYDVNTEAVSDLGNNEISLESETYSCFSE